jgi:hypothetical protein
MGQQVGREDLSLGGCQAAQARMRDRETIDSELRLSHATNTRRVQQWSTQRTLRLCTFSAEKLKLGVMANRTGKTIAAACGGAAVLALALGGVGGAGVPYTNADPSSTEVVPTPSSPDDVCCDDAVQPQARGWDCIIGLNCGQKTPRPRPVPPPPSPPQQ